MQLHLSVGSIYYGTHTIFTQQSSRRCSTAMKDAIAVLLPFGLLFIIVYYPQLIAVPFELGAEFLLDRIIPQPSSG